VHQNRLPRATKVKELARKKIDFGSSKHSKIVLTFLKKLAKSRFQRGTALE
jgi:hypothetical protein